MCLDSNKGINSFSKNLLPNRDTVLMTTVEWSRILEFKLCLLVGKSKYYLFLYFYSIVILLMGISFYSSISNLNVHYVLN